MLIHYIIANRCLTVNRQKRISGEGGVHMRIKCGLKKAVRVTAFLLVFSTLALLFPTMDASGTSIDYTKWIVRVGLNSVNYYSPSTTQQPYANFQIYRYKDSSGNYVYTGTGFQFGYYNNSSSYNGTNPDDRGFVSLYTMPDQGDPEKNTFITVIRSSNFDIDQLTYVGDGASGNVIGGYRIELGLDDFQTQSALDAAVASVNSLLSGSGWTAYPSYSSNGYSVRIGTFTSSAAANAAISSLRSRLSGTYPSATYTVVGRGANAYTVYYTGTATIYFEWDGYSKQLGILPYGGTVSDKIGCETETWHKGYRFYGGFDFFKNSDTTFTVVSVVNLVQYVMGVTPYELYTGWPEESLKAHAVCAATFAIQSLRKHSSLGFDVCSGQNCQVYMGTTQLTTKIKNCVLAVAGMIITYNGSPISAVYHSSNGGYTESSEYVWGGYVPYLRAVRDDFETPYLTTGNNGIWTHGPYTGEYLASKLNANGYSIGKITNVYAAQTTEAGNVYKLALSDGTTTVTLTGENMRFVLGTSILYSQHFNVITTGTSLYVNDGGTTVPPNGAYVITGDGTISPLGGSARTALTANGIETIAVSGGGEATFTFDGKGWGHSVGLGQWGSYGMAMLGYTFDQILKYYYTGVQISGLDY